MNYMSWRMGEEQSVESYGLIIDWEMDADQTSEADHMMCTGITRSYLQHLRPL